MLTRDWLWIALALFLVGGWFVTAQSKAQLDATYKALLRQQDEINEPQVEGRELFPAGREGLIAAMRNERAMLNYRVKALIGELEDRGHKVAITGAGVFVDTPPVP